MQFTLIVNYVWQPCFQLLLCVCSVMVFPGLNLQSQFNLDNITVFNKNEQESTLGQKVKCQHLITAVNILNSIKKIQSNSILCFHVHSTQKKRKMVWRWRKEKWERMMLLHHGKLKSLSKMFHKVFCVFFNLYLNHMLACPCLQFHSDRLQLVQEVLDAAGLLQKPCAVLW